MSICLSKLRTESLASLKKWSWTFQFQMMAKHTFKHIPISVTNHKPCILENMCIYGFNINSEIYIIFPNTINSYILAIIW